MHVIVVVLFSLWSICVSLWPGSIFLRLFGVVLFLQLVCVCISIPSKLFVSQPKPTSQVLLFARNSAAAPQYLVNTGDNERLSVHSFLPQQIHTDGLTKNYSMISKTRAPLRTSWQGLMKLSCGVDPEALRKWQCAENSRIFKLLQKKFCYHVYNNNYVGQHPSQPCRFFSEFASHIKVGITNQGQFKCSSSPY